MSNLQRTTSKGGAPISITAGNIAPRVAVLYQAVKPPEINGIRKPMKPGGYRDSGADIAYVLQQSGTSVVTPTQDPHPESDEGWCFPDTEEGIHSAASRGATHLWANTILFSSHPLQTSTKLTKYASQLKIIGQPPHLVEQYDDKDFMNDLLRKDGTFDLPKSWLVHSLNDDAILNSISYPIVAKPIRGRGSHGVKLCRNRDQLIAHLKGLLAGSSPVMLESYLSGSEGTITVMPPSKATPQYQCMPIVMRFNHADGIAPYNGVVAVTANSAVPPDHDKNQAHIDICRSCEQVAKKLKVTAPIRIDVRQFTEDKDSKFAIFDVNMKPNMTGPGRPGRENQASLTAMAAAAMGWDYPRLLREILASAQPLEVLCGQTID